MDDLSNSNLLYWSKSAEKCPFPMPVGWFFVEYSRNLAPGEHRNIQMLDQEWVLFRGESGKPGMTDPFCPHLGAHLGHGGKVVGDSIRCPFHHWAYNAEGWCTSIPYASEMPPITKRQPILRNLPLVERFGMIWCWYHPRGEAPSFEMFDVPEFESPEGEYITPIERHWPINTAIQELAENGVDFPHLKFLHGGAVIPDAETRFEGPDFYVKMANGYIDGHSRGPGFVVFRFQREGIVSTMFSYSVPISREKTMMRMSFTHRNYPEGSKELEISKHLIDHMIGEADGEQDAGFESVDMIVWDNKKYRQKPILCDGDGPILKYRAWFRQFYADADVSKL